MLLRFKLSKSCTAFVTELVNYISTGAEFFFNFFFFLSQLYSAHRVYVFFRILLEHTLCFDLTSYSSMGSVTTSSFTCCLSFTVTVLTMYSKYECTYKCTACRAEMYSTVQLYTSSKSSPRKRRKIRFKSSQAIFLFMACTNITVMLYSMNINTT